MFITNTNIIVAIPVEVRVADAVLGAGHALVVGLAAVDAVVILAARTVEGLGLVA